MNEREFIVTERHDNRDDSHSYRVYEVTKNGERHLKSVHSFKPASMLMDEITAKVWSKETAFERAVEKAKLLKQYGDVMEVDILSV